MNSRSSKIDTGVGVSFIASAVIHLAVFLLLVWWGRMFPPHLAIQETYYVDVVNLPTVDPLSGTAEQKAGDASAPPPAPAAPMTIPPPAGNLPKAAVKSAKPPVAHEPGETESDFNERLAKLERSTEARHEEAVLEKLRSKVKTSGASKVGIPDSSGTESGSRYADFIKSRLEDALKVTSFSTTKKPEVVVRLTIAADGRLLRMKIERSSGDAAFELAVRRAIDLASGKFTAPPNRMVFENGFIFRPKGITNGTLR